MRDLVRDDRRHLLPRSERRSLGIDEQSRSRNVMAPLFSMAPAAKSGTAMRSSLPNSIPSAEILIEERKLLFGGFERESGEPELVSGRADANRCAVDAPVRHTKSPTIITPDTSDIFGVVANFSVCFPGSGPGSSESTAPFEMAVSAASTMSDTSKVALNRGSSNDGNARRASVASIWVTASPSRWLGSDKTHAACR